MVEERTLPRSPLRMLVPAPRSPSVTEVPVDDVVPVEVGMLQAERVSAAAAMAAKIDECFMMVDTGYALFYIKH